jgi:hypothetical protein
MGGMGGSDVGASDACRTLHTCLSEQRALYSDGTSCESKRGFGWGGRSRGRFATPADFPRHDRSPYSRAHVRRESLGQSPRAKPESIRFATCAPLCAAGCAQAHAPSRALGCHQPGKGSVAYPAYRVLNRIAQPHRCATLSHREVARRLLRRLARSGGVRRAGCGLRASHTRSRCVVHGDGCWVR